MNLRKTIAGAAVAVGSTAVMLGLGGTAQAVDLGQIDVRLPALAQPGSEVPGPPAALEGPPVGGRDDHGCAGHSLGHDASALLSVLGA